MRPNKPTYRLTAGKQPYTSVDLKYGRGRIVIKVSNSWPNASHVLAGIVDVSWKVTCKRILDFVEQNPVSLSDYNSGVRVTLTEPADWPLRNEVGERPVGAS